MSVQALKDRIYALLPHIEAGAAARERDRQLPYEAVRALAQAGLFTLRVPEAAGGPGASVRDVIEVLLAVASVDSNTAQALRPGLAFLEGLLTGAEDDADSERDRWFARYLDGAVLGNAGWEVGGANGAISARIVRQGDHYRVTGSKYYSTGALYADWISVVALDEDDQPRSFVLPRDRQGLVLLDDFDAMGQRLTASGTTRLDDVIVYPDELRARTVQEGTRTIVTPFLQLFLATVQAGIARNALNDAVRFARDHARPIKHSSASRSVDDPYVELSVGEIAARAYAAEAVVLRAADTIDRAWVAGQDPALVEQAAVEVAQAQFITADSALKAAERVFDVGGASTTSRQHNLDRHWRNARTVTNHNPRDWKAA
ncbi:acyl-CoA dehydrogenase family protein, partial [Pseudomonas sp.]|uniref:acyl-CoA dehydrogenase family protein n=1 Tax=Pseudomonas sp. TaxID=306 RepID=UPI00258376AD